MERSRLRKPSLKPPRGCASKRSGVSGSVGEEYATRAQAPDPGTPQTREVSRYRVVVEVALYDRLEPLSGVGLSGVKYSFRSH